jgi:VIT1/CCC1 family predicted Fe2+/Mn2+ transporter
MELYNSWREEKRSVYLYSIMAAHEANIMHKKLFLDLKQAADKQADLWMQKMREQNITPPTAYQPDLRTRLVVVLIKIFGTERLHKILSAMKIRGMSVFTQYHSEHKHTSLNASSNLRAAVFGVNDGLISNMSLILGVAGAETNHHFILIAGIAGLLAGACSMGAGEYISVRSQREVFEYQIAIEKEELAEYPEEEIEELSLIYQARGVPKVEAETLAKVLINNPETALTTLAREELGLNAEDLVSPIGAMVFSFIAFSIGAFIPIVPFLFGDHPYNLPLSIVLTAISLFVIGATLSLFSNKNAILSGLRMLLVGTIAGALTYAIGWLLGVSVS